MKQLIVNENLARLIYRRVQRGLTRWNYCVAARDVSGGIYIQLATCDWCTVAGTHYVNPHWRT